MSYQIGNLGPGRQSGDHKAKAIEKYPHARLEPAVLHPMDYRSIAQPIELMRIERT